MDEPTRGAEKPVRILLVDDSSYDRTLVRRELSREFDDPEIVEVDSPEELERILQDDPYDAVISDYMLGWNDGLSVLHRVRSRWPDSAAVVFTGTGDEEVAVRAMKNGLDDYVVKTPEHIKRLPMAVQRALDRRRRIRALEHYEARTSELMNRLPAGIYRADPDGELLYGNPALARILGLPEDALAPGMSLEELCLEPGERRRWIRDRGDDREQTLEYRIRRPDGDVIWVLDRFRVVRTPEGDPRYLEGTLEDVTDRHRAQTMLARQTRHLELLQAVTAVANEETDLRAALGTAVRKICRATGWPVGHVYATAPEGDRLEPLSLWIDTESTGLDRFRAETRDTVLESGRGLIGRVHASGQPEWIEDLEAADFVRAEAAREQGLRSAIGIPVSADETVAVIELFHPDPQPRDESLLAVLGQAGVQLGRIAERERAVEERRRLRERATEAQKMEALGRLAGGVAHDFNNLLTVLTMAAQIARTEDDVPVPVEEALTTILDTAERAGVLTQQLLTFTKGGAGDSAVFPMAGAIEDVRPMLERVLGESYRLESRIHDPDARVRLDRGQLEQVVVNLVLNARDAMPGGGRIHLEVDSKAIPEAGDADAPADHVILSVTDEGVGIPPDVQARIFEPLFTTKDEGGTGLGLSICYGIVAEADGEIRVYSEVGMGTTFRVLLPKAEGPVTEVRRDEDRAPLTGTERVLVVEDDDAVRAMTVGALEAQGYDVMDAPDGETALDVLSSGAGQGVEMLVSDVILPGIHGPEVVRRAREIRPGLPAILMSGYSRVLLHGRIEATDGEVRVLQKPYSLHELSHEVRRAIDDGA